MATDSLQALNRPNNSLGLAGIGRYTDAIGVSLDYSWSLTEETGSSQWLMRRNCSLSPRQLAIWFLTVSIISLGVASLFALAGAWMILPFAFLEVAALGVAFVVYARHAADFERIVVKSDGVVIERRRASRVEQTEVSLNWLRIEYQGERRELVKLIAPHCLCEVGCFVPEHQRSLLAKQLKLACFANTPRNR